MKKKLFTSVTAVAIAFATLATPYIPLSTQTVLAAGETAKPTFKDRTEIPAAAKWKLSDIYVDQAAWEADVKKAEELATAFTAHQGKLGTTPAALKKALDDYVALSRVFDKAYVYANLALDANSSNTDLQSNADRADTMLALLSEKTAFISPEIVAIPDAKLKELLAAPELADYKVFIEENVRTKNHTLKQEMEELLAQLSPNSATPNNVYGMLTKDIKYPNIKDSNGKEVPLNRANFISYLESKDRNVRKQAFDAYYGSMTQFQDTLASTLAAHVKSHNISAKVRNYDSAVEAALKPNNIPTSVYDALVDTVNDNLDQMHRYMELKKRLLGVSELHMYDIYTTIVESEDKYIPYEDAKKMVLDGLKPLGKEYADLLQKSYNEGWIDVYSTDDKRSGAYQWGTYDTHPYVLLNYQGSLDDVNTLAHELGHAMHSYYSNKNQAYTNSNYPTFTAEVASTMNEALMFQSMYKNAKTNQEKMYLLNQYLENFRSTLFRQTQFAEFEKLIHEKEAAGESLNSANLKKWYLDINKKYYGNTMISDEGISMEWSRIPHFFRNFYVYQYATSFAASQALAKQVMDEGQPAVDRIRDNFLSAGNSKPPIEVLKAAGVDMSSAQPIEQAMELFKETLDEFEALVEQAEKEKPKPTPGKGINVTINGKAQSFDAAPVNVNGTVLVPMRAIFEALGASLQWNDATQTVTATKGETVITLKIGANSATVNGKTVALAQPAQTVNSRALVPTRFIAEALGANVGWDAATNTVVITN